MKWPWFDPAWLYRWRRKLQRNEQVTEMVAKAAGGTLASLSEATLVDAIVMASAATRGAMVYTSDVDDLERLRRRFPDVRVLHL